MLKRFFQTGKKGVGLSDFFSILAFALLIIIFYLLFKITVGKASFQLSSESNAVQDAVSLLGILRTKAVVDNSEMTIAELIALAKSDATKNNALEKELKNIMDESSSCAIFCIEDNQLKGKNCNQVEIYPCSDFKSYVPGYSNPIEVSFISDAESEIINLP